MAFCVLLDQLSVLPHYSWLFSVLSVRLHLLFLFN